METIKREGFMAFLLQNRQIIRFFILESYIGQTFVFCSDSARLGEKIPQRSEDDFFSQPVRRTALRIRSKRLPLHVRNRNTGFAKARNV